VTVKRASIIALLAAGAALAGCGNVRESLGVEKKAPDEFAVVRRAPLSVPPNYELRPPRPGERPPPQINPREQAQSAVFGVPSTGQAAPVAATAGETALIETLRLQAVDPSIRQQVDRESALLALDQRGFVEQLMFWRDPPPPGTALDAAGEQRRLQENDALGKSVTTGESPTIERKDTVRNRIF
jgi:hypothetical protein